uniref:Uncharacterized protein n=1 Tax=Anguilla anguilla TaxID=7936 RepID=A0A0E9UXJ4_ANGAN
MTDSGFSAFTYFRIHIWLDTEAQLLLLVGYVTADCTNQRHGNSTGNARNCARHGCVVIVRIISRDIPTPPRAPLPLSGL